MDEIISFATFKEIHFLLVIISLSILLPQHSMIGRRAGDAIKLCYGLCVSVLVPACGVPVYIPI